AIETATVRNSRSSSSSAIPGKLKPLKPRRSARVQLRRRREAAAKRKKLRLRLRLRRKQKPPKSKKGATRKHKSWHGFCVFLWLSKWQHPKNNLSHQTVAVVRGASHLILLRL